MPNKPKFIAHRGYAARYPENTIIAIEAAINAGAEFVEVDVQLASDGTPVLFHDRTLTRMCSVDGMIADYTLQQLARLEASEAGRFGDAFAGTPIATLHELAKLIRQSSNVQFFIELKRISIKRHGAECLLEQTIQTLQGLQHQCTLISFDSDILAMARLRQWRTGWVTKWGKHEQEDNPFSLLFCDIEGLPASGELRLPGILLAVYEVDDATQARQLAARGVDFIETFSIGDMQDTLNAR